MVGSNKKSAFQSQSVDLYLPVLDNMNVVKEGYEKRIPSYRRDSQVSAQSFWLVVHLAHLIHFM